jgi:hypothetical protein
MAKWPLFFAQDLSCLTDRGMPLTRNCWYYVAMKNSSSASQMILDAYWCADGVWRVPPATRNQAREQNGFKPLEPQEFSVSQDGNDWKFVGHVYVDHVDIDYDEIMKRLWREYPFTTGT